MRKFLALAVLWLCHVCVIAAGIQDLPAESNFKYKVDYLEEQTLYRKGQALTVSHFQLEWPSCLCYSAQAELQNFLCNEVFGFSEISCEKGMRHYYSTLGERIQKMPDDALSVGYYICKLIILGYDEGRYISFLIHKTRRDSKYDKESMVSNKVYTYDLVGHKILSLSDVISPKYNASRIHLYHEAGMPLLTKREERVLVEQSFYGMVEEKACTACVIPYGIVICPADDYADDGEAVLNAVPIDYVKSALAKPLRKILNNQQLAGMNLHASAQSVRVSLEESVVDTTLVYDVVEKAPQFQDGSLSMKKYFADNLDYPDFENITKKEGKVVVSFVVDRQGFVCSPSVVSPCSPGIDREAARALMAMPKWIPGSQNGIALNTRVTLPLTFSLK